MWDYLSKTKKPILLYGMGDGADKIANVLEKRQTKISGVFANDGFVRGQSFRGFPVLTYRQAEETFGSFIALLCYGTHREEVIKQIQNVASRQELLAPDVPVTGNGLFDKKYYEDNKSDFDNIRRILADEKSKQVFDDVISYKLSGDIKYLFSCEGEISIPLSDDEIYLDLGAYSGDTVLGFVKSVLDYKKIIAVEPEDRNFRKLKENTKDLHDVSLFNIAIGNKIGSTYFSHAKGRGGKSGSGREIKMDTVDNILNKEKVTYIKFDTEGEEVNAIKGAKKTIAKYKPKMEIAAYHRYDDLISIFKTVNNIRDDYKIYLRHSRCLPGWEINYYFI